MKNFILIGIQGQIYLFQPVIERNFFPSINENILPFKIHLLFLITSQILKNSKMSYSVKQTD